MRALPEALDQKWMDRFVSLFEMKGTSGAQMLAIESDDELKELGMADVDCYSIYNMHCCVGQAWTQRSTESTCCSSSHERVLPSGS